jgi:ribose-phosphate pyrophosphokinase
MARHLTLLSGSANKELAEKVAAKLGKKLTPIEIKRFNDGEIYVRVLESVRGHDVFVIQPTSPPANDNLMELLIIVDALKRASARQVTVVIPYYGYARQDRKATSREPITARLVADLLEKAGISRIVTFDLHVDQIQGFFNVPMDHLAAMPILAKAIIEKKLSDIVVVSPDVGGATRARRLGKVLNSEIAIIDKRRPKHGESHIINIIGEVEGKTAILLDDIIDTAGTIANAAVALKEKGVKEVYICATHPILSNNAVERLSKHEIKEIIVTDTIQIPKEKKIDKIKVVSLAPFIAELIHSIFEGEPMGEIVRKKREELKH